jgi:hypothetical protein
MMYAYITSYINSRIYPLIYEKLGGMQCQYIENFTTHRCRHEVYNGIGIWGASPSLHIEDSCKNYFNEKIDKLP